MGEREREGCKCRPQDGPPLDGAGLAWVTEDRIAEHLESGALIRVLEDWCPPFPGFFLYYPTRKQQPAALTAVITAFRLVG